MGSPTFTSIDHFGSLCTVMRQILNIGKQGGITFGKIADIGCPIILFCIDIQMIVIGPAHVARLVVIEETLQGNGQWRVFTRTGNGEVTAILEEQGIQTSISLAFLHLFPTNIRRQRAVSVLPEMNRNTIIQRVIILYMRLLQFIIRFSYSLLHAISTKLLVIRTFIIGTHINNQSHGISFFYTYSRLFHLYLSIISQNGYSPFKTDSARTMQGKIYFSGKYQLVIFYRKIGLTHQIQSHIHSNGLLLISGQAEYENIIRVCSKILTFIVHTTGVERNAADSLIQA